MQNITDFDIKEYLEDISCLPSCLQYFLLRNLRVSMQQLDEFVNNEKGEENV